MNTEIGYALALIDEFLTKKKENAPFNDAQLEAIRGELVAFQTGNYKKKCMYLFDRFMMDSNLITLKKTSEFVSVLQNIYEKYSYPTTLLNLDIEKCIGYYELLKTDIQSKQSMSISELDIQFMIDELRQILEGDKDSITKEHSELFYNTMISQITVEFLPIFKQVYDDLTEQN